MPRGSFIVNVMWDDEVKVYVAMSDDVPGLVTEAPNWEALMGKLRVMVPELLEANHHLVKRDDDLRETPPEIVAHYLERIRLQPA
jgi:hypothetical protein